MSIVFREHEFLLEMAIEIVDVSIKHGDFP